MIPQITIYGNSDSDTPASAIQEGKIKSGQDVDKSTGSTTSGSTSTTVGTGNGNSGVDNYGAAPAKADAAPKTSVSNVTGLCEALNRYQQKLVQQGNYEIADIYEIVFDPPSLASSKVKKPGPTNSARTTMQSNATAREKSDPSTNSMNTNSETFGVAAGTQVIQVIDQIMKNSQYIADQQIYIINKDGKTTPNPANTNGQTAWYNVTLKATQLGYDNKRRDFAYKLTYTVTPYAINNMQSQYFPKSGFRGLHKSYKYWFTGENTEVLKFEQDYNYLYRLIISGNAPNPQNQTSDSREVTRRIYQNTSEQGMQGGDNKSTEPAANAADYLYSQTDQSKIKLSIMGDPAWLEQADIQNNGGGTRIFNFSPFLPDGTINVNSQQVVFDISWNKASDYNLQTGLMPVTSDNPKINATYTAVKCVSTFSHGKFEQNLEGILLTEYFQNNKNNIGATTPGNELTPVEAKSITTDVKTSGAEPALGVTEGRITSQSPSSIGNEPSTAGSGAAPDLRPAGPAPATTSNGEDIMTPAQQQAYEKALQQIAEAKKSGTPTGDAVAYTIGEDRIRVNGVLQSPSQLMDLDS